MIIGDLALANDEMVGQNATYRLVEAAADGFVRHLEICPGLGPPGLELRKRLLDEIERRRRRIGLKIRARPIALDRIAPLRNLPLELHLGLQCGLRQINLHAMACCLDVADVD